MNNATFWMWTLLLLFLATPLFVVVILWRIGKGVEKAGDELLRVEEEMKLKETI